MRFVIATGLYPPDVGGPAFYAEGVKKALDASGHETRLVLFGSLRKYPSGIRHALYAARLFFAARGADAIFAFDTYSAGVPAAFVGALRHIPVVLRVGGDFVWESYVERTKNLVPLPDFYQKSRDLSLKEKLAKQMVRWMLHHTIPAFNSPWLLSIWKEPYSLERVPSAVVENVIGERLSSLAKEPKLLFYGRNLALKNAAAFKNTLEQARQDGVQLSLEEGMVSHAELLERIRHAYAVALPSISDVAPNVILDAIRCGKPFLLTKHSGYAVRFKDLGVIVDPLSAEDMARGIRELADTGRYANLVERIGAYKEVRTYDDVARELLALATRGLPSR